MAWTDIPDTDIDADSPLTETLMTQIRDNIEFVRTKTEQIFTSSGTWTKPADLYAVKVTVIGGGGGGGGVNSSASSDDALGGGGASGGCAIEWILAASIGATETVTIGAGGTAGRSSGVINYEFAGTGGTSSFGSHCSATGGQGGVSVDNLGNDVVGIGGQTPGVGSGGDVNIRGTVGFDAKHDETADFFIKHSGAGGPSFLGGAGYGRTTDGTGISGAIGGGGGGAASIGTGNDRTGGTGGAGIVIVEEFY